MAKLMTSISSASIFRNNAEVVREGKCHLDEGSQILQVFGLGAGTQSDSVRLSATGLQCRDFRFEPYEDEDKESLRIAEEIDGLLQQIEIKQLQKELWKDNGDFYRRPSFSAEQISEYINALPLKIAGLNDDIAKLQKQIAQLQKDKEKAELKEKAQILVCEVVAPEAGEYRFELTYQETYAGWKPVYEIRAREGEPLVFYSKARIFQNTQEDWKDISVTLYSSDPDFTGEYEEPVPITLDFRNNEIFKSVNRLTAAGNGDMMLAMEEAAPMEKLQTAPARVSHEDTVSEYQLPGKRTILSASNGNLADLQTYEVKAQYRNISAPKNDPRVYLIATIANEDLPFEQGISAAIYLNDIYSRDVSLYPDFSKEKTDITLGKQEQVHVSYKQVSRKASQALLKNSRSIEYVYEALFSNLADKDKQVLFKDQIPVSQNKDIKVELIDSADCELEAESGILSKEVHLPAKGSQSLRIAYKVTYPKDKTIQESRGSFRKFCPECGSIMKGNSCPSCGYCS